MTQTMTQTVEQLQELLDAGTLSEDQVRERLTVLNNLPGSKIHYLFRGKIKSFGTLTGKEFCQRVGIAR